MPPIITIVSVSRDKLSDEEGFNQSIITVKFSEDVQQYIAMLNGVDYSTGTLVHSGGSVSANVDAQVIIDWNELFLGNNKINIYGQGADGLWTGQVQTVIIKSTYGSRRYGTGIYGRKG